MSTRRRPRRCFFVVAGRRATADGSVLMGYNNDWWGNNNLHIDVVPRRSHERGAVFRLSGGQALPQPPETWRYIAFRNVWTEGDPTPEGGLNEHQVGILFGTEARPRAEVAQADPPRPDGVGTELWTLVLERARTAREGLELAAELLDRYGAGPGIAGSTLAIGDPQEVWIIEVAGGTQWLAQRLPDDAVFAEANALQLRGYDPDDGERFRASPGLLELARRMGTWNPSAGPFDFARAYGGESSMSPYNRRRVWRAQTLLAPSSAPDPEAPYEACPLFVRPDRPLGPRDLMRVLRDHYEDTPYDPTEGYRKGTPHWRPFSEQARTICISATNYSAVWQLRGHLPAEIGGLVWVAQATPCTSVYLPFYLGITDTPAVYRMGDGHADEQSAFWVYRRVGNLANVRYHEFKPLVRQVWDAFEDELFACQPAVEAAAVELHESWAGAAAAAAFRACSTPARHRAFLTRYVHGSAWRAYELGKELLRTLHTRLAALERLAGEEPDDAEGSG